MGNLNVAANTKPKKIIIIITYKEKDTNELKTTAPLKN